MSTNEDSMPKPALSLADRITGLSVVEEPPTNGTAASSREKRSTSWADDVASPVEPKQESQKGETKKVEQVKEKEKTESKTEPELESKPGCQTESKPEPRTESKPGSEAESKPEVRTDSKSKSEVGSKTESKPKSETASKTKSETEAKPEPKTDTVEASQLDGAGSAQNGSGLLEPDYTVEVKLSDLRADPNNPLHSVTEFEDIGLSQEILDGLSVMKFRKPSKIQEKALPLLLSDPPTNMIGQSQSGTGKTAAFVLTMLSRVDYTKPTTPQALCLAPTRELARQIMGVIQTMGQFIKDLTVQFAIPQALERGKKVASEIVVGTPGTVLDLIKRKALDTSQIKVYVLDEADNMLDQQGLGDQCLRVRNNIPKNGQILLFSATFPPAVLRFAQKFAPNANELTLKHEELTVEGIRQLYLDCNSERDKYDILVRLYGLMNIGSSIIFVKRRDTASEIERRMSKEGHTVVALHSDLEAHVRDRVIDSFRSNAAKVLITTNVLARGIDVSSVSIVINYDIPELPSGRPDPQTYLHRIGRTGRFGRVGVSISFVYDRRSWNQLQEISQYFGVPIHGVETADWDAVEEAVQKVIKSSRAGTNLKIE